MKTDIDFNELMKKTQILQTQLQEKLKDIQAELGNTVVTGSAGAGLVTVKIIASTHDIKSIELDPSLLDEKKPLAERKTLVQDLTAAAFNAALRSAEQVTKEKMAALASALPFDQPVTD